MRKTKVQKKRNREKKINWSGWKTGGIAASLIAALTVFAVMLQTEKKVLTQYEKGVIYIAQREIPQGMAITAKNRELYFQLRELDKNCIPPTALTRPEQAEGLVADYDIEVGTLLTEGMFESLNEITAAMSEPCITGFKADDLYQVVGGVLRAGDRIHIYSVAEGGEAELIWDNVYIQGVFDQTGASILNGDETAAAQRVNIYLDKEDIPKFYSGLARGSIRVVKVLD